MAPAAQAEINDPSSTSRDPVVDRPIYDSATLEAQANRDVFSTSDAQSGRAQLEPTEPEPQIVIGHPGTPTTARDPENVTGIGQMIVDNTDGTIGLCTGTLINPRAVLFAAHCVNTRAASAYGSPTGGTAIGFGFGSNNNAPGASAFGGWLNGIAGGPEYQTNTGRYMYNVNQVAWHQDSVAGLSGGFRQADIAIATLDTPASDIPTWALLFSQLPATAGGANGTGYHVNIAGYGNNGTGATGSNGGIDYRRRVAENMLGALVSLDDFTSFLFGTTTGALPQNLYWIDFDDPRRGTAQADPRDFNAWRDNPTPREGITASGDSGGPLILDSTYARQLVIGVLSGGYTRFFNGAPANGYGTAAFYQPIYLYWDWIAANNPYRYVSSMAGNANWNDASHWVTDTDPNYFIIGPNGDVVNGVPTDPGTGIADTPGGEFGEACFESGGVSECYNYANEEYTLVARPIGTDAAVDAPVGGVTLVPALTLENGAGADLITSLDNGDPAQRFTLTPSEPTAQNGQSPNALPAATIANGLPGATNFVPNNVDPNPGQGIMGRYFDVTLAATGTTTLDTAVTIDRFAIAGGGAALNITSTGSLTSLIDITQATGTMQVNGSLTTPGDYLMMTGGLNGTGTITTPFFTSMAGVIAPGTAGTTGTLTFRGNVILASGTRYLLDLGGNGVSDRIAVRTNGAGTGLADLGGTLVFGFNASTMRNGNVYTILTSEGGISGAFNTPGAISAILTPKLTYSANAVTLAIEAGSYTNVVTRADPVAYSYAQLLDRNRSQAATLDSLYGPLDLQNAATIRDTLNGLRPATETLVQSLALVGVDNMASLVGDRVDQLAPGSTGGTFARFGQPNQIAAVGLSGRGVAGLSGMGFDTDVRADTGAAVVEEGVLPESVNAFVAGGYLRGDSAPAAGVAGRDEYDGWYAAGGIETWNDKGAIGFAFSYTRLDGDGAFAATRARANLYQGSLYGKLKLGEHGFGFDAKLIAGLLDGTTSRTVSIVGTPYTLRSESGSLVVVGELGLGKDFVGNGVRVTPRVATRMSHIGFSRTREEGGPTALVIDREPLQSVQGRAGITFAGTGSKFRPTLNGSYVYEFADRPSTFGANFVGGIGSNALFALNGTDRDYFEVGGGLTITAGTVDLSVAAETTLGRQDYNGQSYRASLSFKF